MVLGWRKDLWWGVIPGCLLFLVEDVCGNLDQATCLQRRFLSRQEAELLWSGNRVLLG